MVYSLICILNMDACFANIKTKKKILLIDDMSVPFKKKSYVWGDDNDGTNCFNADSRNEIFVFLLAL